jgi:hypothetical protein
MNEVEAIRAELRCGLDGDPWHGSSLTAILDGITAADAWPHPVPGRHSAWEVLLHITGWTREAARRLRGEVPGLPAEGDWPEAPGADAANAGADGADLDEAWRAAIDVLHRAHAELDAGLASFPEERLDERIGDGRDAPLGTGVSWRRMILGVLQHDAYHGGQIALLGKMARGDR